MNKIQTFAGKTYVHNLFFRKIIFHQISKDRFSVLILIRATSKHTVYKLLFVNTGLFKNRLFILFASGFPHFSFLQVCNLPRWLTRGVLWLLVATIHRCGTKGILSTIVGTEQYAAAIDIFPGKICSCLQHSDDAIIMFD